MKKHLLTCSAIVLVFVVVYIATLGGKIMLCTCGGMYKVPLGFLPIHYHLKGDDWNKLHESPESYFTEEDETDGSFKFRGYGGGDVKVPATINGKAVKSVSFNNTCWNVTGVYFPDGVTSIPENCFETPKYGTAFDDLYIEKVYIPNSVTKIGAGAFSATNLKNISVPDSVTEIGESAFSSCESLENITLSNNLTKIGSNAFEGCKNLKNATYKGKTYDYAHINDLYAAING